MPPKIGEMLNPLITEKVEDVSNFGLMCTCYGYM